jgi:hypothetical protein
MIRWMSSSLGTDFSICLRNPSNSWCRWRGFALGDHFCCGDVQGCKQDGCAVAELVVGDALHVAQDQPLRGSRWLRQKGLGAVQGLDLRLLVDAEHHRLV